MFGRKIIAELVEVDENLIPLAIDASERRLRVLPPQGDLRPDIRDQLVS
jgi:hypothetical protein